MKPRQVVLVAHDPRWAAAFEDEAARLASVWGTHLLDIQHAGSTSIPGIQAKPIIDLVVIVDDLQALDEANETMVALGYTALGEHGIPGRRFFFRTLADGTRSHHVHAFAPGNPEIARMLDFRDYLRAHPADALAYQSLKQHLAEQFRFDVEAYSIGKSKFIEEILRKARGINSI